MKAEEVKEKRKQEVINSIKKDIEQSLIKNKWLKTCISCPDDLYDIVKTYFETNGFKVWREKYQVCDIEGWGTSEYSYLYYIGI